MNRFFLVFGLLVGVVSLTSLLTAQDKKPPQKVIGIHTPNGWLLDVNADGSGYLQFGSSAQDGWPFKPGTLDVKQAEKDLKALTPDKKWLGAKSHAFWLASEAKGPDKEVSARYSRDTEVITALLKKAMEATENRSTFDADRKAQLMKANPLGELPELPKEK